MVQVNWHYLYFTYFLLFEQAIYTSAKPYLIRPHTAYYCLHNFNLAG